MSELRGGGSTSLCARCVHVREVRSERGSTFVLCTLARLDPSFAKYPMQPVRWCLGHEAPSVGDDASRAAGGPRDGDE